MFGSYSKGFSVPRTDNLYGFDSVEILAGCGGEAGKRPTRSIWACANLGLIQAQVAGWYIKYDNRIISSLVQLDGRRHAEHRRNVGATKTKGIDASLGINPSKHFSIYGFVSYLDSELLQDAINPQTGAVLAATKGKFVVETPKWQYGGRAQFRFDPVSFGIQAKHTGDRFVTDVNDLISKGYTLVDLDARFSMASLG